MTTYTWPSTDAFLLREFELGLRSNVLMSVSPLTGATQTVELPGARFVGAGVLPPATLAQAAERDAFFAKVAGQANRIALWHPARPVPRGTMRGTPTLSAHATAGATSLSITTTAGATLLAGDWIKIGYQLVQVVDDTTANGSGAMSCNIRAAVRVQVNSGASVVWDKPTGLYLLQQSEVRVPYAAARGEPISLEFVEDISS